MNQDGRKGSPVPSEQCNHVWREVRNCDGELRPYNICIKCKAGLILPARTMQSGAAK